MDEAEAEADLSDGVLVGVAMKLLGLVAIGERERETLRGVGEWGISFLFEFEFEFRSYENESRWEGARVFHFISLSETF